MSDEQLSVANGLVAGTMKLALEYNAAVVGTATAWYGNIQSSADMRRYRQALKKLEQDYADDRKKLLEDFNEVYRG